MEPRFETLTGKKLVGKRLKMSIANNQTAELWKSFMLRRNEIINPVSTNLYSLQTYPPFYFEQFNPTTEFEKWATVEVEDYCSIPEDMEKFDLEGGLYAVFVHKGPASEGAKTFQFIFGSWLPNSGFEVDTRPHFEILGEKYKNNQPESEEEIWIPIKFKA